MEKSKVIIDNEVWLPRRISEFFFLISFLVLLDGKHPLYAAERIHLKKKKKDLLIVVSALQMKVPLG